MIRPRPLGWLYLLLAAVLLSVALTAGEVFFTTDFDRLRPAVLGLAACERRFPGPYEITGIDGIMRCLVGPSMIRIEAMYLAVAAVLVAFGAVLILVPLADGLRLRRHRGRYPVEPAAARFAELCDLHGLTGVGRPRMLVAGPPVRQAFTTAVPGRAPLVVLPLAVALAHGDPSRFDVVVEHEFAHVRARDVVWVNGVRGLVLLTLPVMAAASASGFLDGFTSPMAVPAMLRGLAIVLAVVPLSAYLLRQREREADAYVAATGDGSALSRLFERAPPAARRPGPLRRLFARHPSPADRLAALSQPDVSAEGGFGHAALAGVVAMIVAGAVRNLLMGIDYAFLRDDVILSCAGASVVMVGGLGPSLLRRCARLRAAGLPRRWWQSAAGLTAGLLAGGYVLPAQASSVRGGLLNLPGWSGAVSSTILLTVGAVTLVSAIGLTAESLAGIDDRPGVGWLRAMVLLAMTATGTALWWTLHRLDDVARGEHPLTDLAFGLSRHPWPLLAAPLPLALLLLLTASRPPGGVLGKAARRAILAGFTVGTGALVAHAVLRSTADFDRWVHLVQERAWIGALAGVAVLAGITAGRGVPSAAQAVVSGMLVATSIGALHLGAALLLTGRDDSDLVQIMLVQPVVWYLAMALLATPVLLRLAQRPARNGTVRAPAISTLVAAGAATVMLGPGVPTAGPTVRPTPAPSTAVIATSPSRPPADPGRPLTDDDLRRITDAAAPVMPAYWRTEPAYSGVRTHRSSPVVPRECGEFYNLAYLDALAERWDGLYHAEYVTKDPDVGTVTRSKLTVTVSTAADPVPAGAEASTTAVLTKCPHFVIPGRAPYGDVTIRAAARPAPSAGTQHWAVTFDLTSKLVSGRDVVVAIVYGHNLALIRMTAIVEPLDEGLLTEAVARIADAMAH